jgi:prepilin-type N-terminal cleavage/methylation domain-containing protein
MNCKLRTDKAFTLIELLVAVAILAIVLSFASVIFRVSINAHRTAIANAEIMQKVRAITDQLSADFKSLRKDGEVFAIWVARPVPAADYRDNDLDGYERFDRIMFFADGDFQPYRANPMVRGNIARICYLLAKQGGIRAEAQNPAGRVLARTQHILTADPDLADFLDPNGFGDQQWFDWNNRYEYDKVSLQDWKTGFTLPQKEDMLSVITDIRFSPRVVDSRLIGATVEPADPNSIHMLLCEGGRLTRMAMEIWRIQILSWIRPAAGFILHQFPEYCILILGTAWYCLGECSRIMLTGDY